MTCEHASDAGLSGYVDGELPVEQQHWWDQHLGECPACRAELARLRALSASLKRHLPPREPSSAFREDLRRLLRAEPVGRRPRSRIRLPEWGAALAAGLVFAVGFGLGHQTGGAGAGDPIVAQVVAGHVRSLEVDHLVDVVSSEHHVVKPWFAGKLDFSPPVPDLAEEGFPLIGGRIDYLGGRQVAALVYQRGPHRINLLLWPGTATRCTRGPSVVKQGFNLAHGQAAGMEFWAVSDLNRQELEEFVTRWQHGAAPGEEGCA
ncbi:MAG TPA: anti-sigma factor [Gemmatimonadales bacterium]|jgi:anti-sigma factor RsiW|nr:anti-sigma factor [Gemmatimonadales bacterium]